MRKPIPDKLVVLTFDDGPASGYTVVAPILKSLGFGGSFYVCDFDSFRTRKDWYMTWRQMKALADDGFEIGNHTVGHGGSLPAFLAMEDELLANRVPRPTTVCWPLYAVDSRIIPDLMSSGYTFGRGGHERPYRPTVDNPFDVPSFTIRDGVAVETFVKQARQACQGRIVVYTFHGVPDTEHAGVSLEPATFKAMMQYLKDNHYRVIAMRDLSEYIDPAKAARLSPTKREFKETGPVELATEEKPYVPAPVGPETAPENARPAVPALNAPVNLFTGPLAKDDRTREFVWSKAASGNWSDAASWRCDQDPGSAPAAAGRADYLLSFSMPGSYTVTNDRDSGFVLNRLDLKPVQGQGVTVAGNLVKFAVNPATGALPSINELTLFGRDRIDAPVDLAGDLAVNLIPAGRLVIGGLISGKGRLVYTGGNANASGDLNSGPNQHYSSLTLNHPANTYGGGTVVNGGTLRLATTRSLGTGPLTLNEGAGFVPGSGDGVNPLVLNGGTIDAGRTDWNAPIALNGNTRIAGQRVNLNNASGAISGAGGFTVIGTWGAFTRRNDSEVYLWGANTYAGPTVVQQGTLFVKRAASLYAADATKWTPARISVHPAAALVVSVGGPGELTGAQAGVLLRNLTTSVDHSGLMARACFCLDTANAGEAVTIAADIRDSGGPGGGAFVLRKRGAGALHLSGRNTYTGRTIVEGGTLIVESLNSVVNGKTASSLGAPSSLENGIIELGGDCALTYVGRGEVTDRVLNLTGEEQTVTLDQSGRGRLKLTGSLDISGHGHSKVLVLTGSGAGEFAGDIGDPYDRRRMATLAVTKAGTGVWTLSGANSYSGPTTVEQGTLSLAGARSLGTDADVSVAEGAMLDLAFRGTLKVRRLVLGGAIQPPGTYGAANAPRFIRGAGVLTIR